MDFVDSEDALYKELWHACAGPLVTVPSVGERVFYFPQGHLEQVLLLSACFIFFPWLKFDIWWLFVFLLCSFFQTCSVCRFDCFWRVYLLQFCYLFFLSFLLFRFWLAWFCSCLTRWRRQLIRWLTNRCRPMILERKFFAVWLMFNWRYLFNHISHKVWYSMVLFLHLWC